MKFNVENMKSLFQSNETAQGIGFMFGLRQRQQRSTNLKLLKQSLIQEGIKLVDEDFMKTFKNLQDQGVGALSKKGDRFNWYFNLKDVAKVAHGDTTLPPRPLAVSVTGDRINTAPKKSPGRPAKRRRGRPKGSKSSPSIVPIKTDKKGAYIQILIPRSMLSKIRGL